MSAQWSPIANPTPTPGTNIYYNSGNVGIGTFSPGYRLDVNGGATRIANGTGSDYATRNDVLVFNRTDFLSQYTNKITSSNSNVPADTGLNFELTNTAGTGFVTAMSLRGNGNVGIGTTSPGYRLDVNGGATRIANGTGSDYATRNDVLVFNRTDFLSQYTNKITSSNSNVPADTGLNFELTNTAGTGFVNVMSLRGNGNVGIGVNPSVPLTERLEVDGNIKLSGTGNINAPGTIEANNIKAKYQDVAEWVPSSEQLAAATVVVLDSTKSNQVISSSQSYDTRVAGVISAQPGIALGEKSDNKVLVATTGRVKVKVDTSKGPIHIGDLLVTSDVPGAAMKSEAVSLSGVQFHRPGTLIGKALEPLEKGRGEILVLLSLQ